MLSDMVVIVVVMVILKDVDWLGEAVFVLILILDPLLFNLCASYIRETTFYFYGKEYQADT